MWPKIKTALVVLLLSGLIWVFAEQSVTKTTPVPVHIELNQSRDDLLVQLIDPQGQTQPFIQVDLDVEGPSRRIQEIAEQILKPQLAPLTLEQIGYPESENSPISEFTRDVTSLLNRELAFDDNVILPITGARPPQLQFRAIQLEQADLNVKVYAQDSNNPLDIENLRPQKVTAFVQVGTTPDAEVYLNVAQQNLAATDEISALAEVKLLGRTHQSFPVKLKLANTAGSSWSEETIPSSQIRINILKPSTLVGKYDIENIDAFINEVRDIYGPIRFQGTFQARQEYRNSFHLVLEIREYDTEPDRMSGSRPLTYHIPPGRLDQMSIINPINRAVSFRLKKIDTDDQIPAETGKIIKKSH